MHFKSNKNKNKPRIYDKYKLYYIFLAFVFLLSVGLVGGVKIATFVGQGNQKKSNINKVAKYKDNFRKSIEATKKSGINNNSFITVEIPSDISLEKIKNKSLTPEENRKIQLKISQEFKKDDEKKNKIRENYPKSIKEVEENHGDKHHVSVVVLTKNNEPIFPDLENYILGNKKIGNGDLTFEFESKDFNQTEITHYRSVINKVYPYIKKVYGAPAFSNKVKIIKTTEGSPYGLERGYYSPFNNEIAIERFSDESRNDNVLIHEIIHAFRDDSVITYKSWEEGMTMAMEIVSEDNFQLNRGGVLYSGYDYFDSDVASSNFVGDLLLTENQRYLGSAYAWLKAYFEDDNFFKKFNNNYYAKLNEPTIFGFDENLLKETVAKVKPMVEGKKFGDWYLDNYVLYSGNSVQAYRLGDPYGVNGLYLGGINEYAVPVYYTNSNNTTTVAKNIDVNVSLRDRSDKEIVSKNLKTNDYGYLIIGTNLGLYNKNYKNYKGLLKIKIKISNRVGSLSREYYALYNIVTPNTNSYGIYGFVDSDSVDGAIQVTNINNKKMTVANLLNDSFQLENTSGRGSYKIEYSAGGKKYTKYITKDKGSYQIILRTDKREIGFNDFKEEINKTYTKIKFRTKRMGSVYGVYYKDGSIYSNTIFQNAKYSHTLYFKYLEPNSIYRYEIYFVDNLGNVSKLKNGSFKSGPGDGDGPRGILEDKIDNEE